MTYKIKNVEHMTGLTSHTIRYYEKEGILPPIERDKNGIRIFSEQNLAWLLLVSCLKQTDMPVRDIKEIVRLSQIGEETMQSRKELLEQHKKKIEHQIESLKESMEKIDKKIAFYDGADHC